MACYICDVCREKLSTKQCEHKEFQRVSSLESSFTCSECWKLFSMAFEVTNRDEKECDTFSERTNLLRSHSCESTIDCRKDSHMTGNSGVTEPKFTTFSSVVESYILPSDECGENSATYNVQNKKGNKKESSYVCKRSSSINNSCYVMECDEKSPIENQHVNNIPLQIDETSQIYISPSTVKTGENNNLQTNLNSSKYDISNDNIGYKSYFVQPVFKDHDKSSLECNICHITLNTEGSFKKHMNKHDETNPFVCKVCKKSCTTRYNLNKHMSKHTNERPFKCNICSWTFKLKKCLMQHLVTHLDKRPYKCNSCFATFKMKRYLSQHMLTHSEDRPYKCHICSSTFKFQNILYRHVVNHSEERPYKCNSCSSTFKMKRNLSQHMLKHSEDRPYKCNICFSKIKSKRNFNRHMTKHIIYL